MRRQERSAILGALGVCRPGTQCVDSEEEEQSEDDDATTEWRGCGKRGLGALVEEDIRCGGDVESGRGAARKQRRGKHGSSAIQFEERLLKVAERAMDYMESRGSVDR